MNSELKQFIHLLKNELEERYIVCDDFSATPSSILLAILNAIAETERKMLENPLDKHP